jgi:hypothetical protein
MTMKVVGTIIICGLLSLALGMGEHTAAPSATPPENQVTFVGILKRRLTSYDNKNRSLAASLFDLAYRYRLPMGLEYINRDIVWRPVKLRVENKSLASIVQSLIAATHSDLKVDFSSGLIDVYKPEIRSNPRNVLNTMIAKFQLKGVGPEFASIYLAGSLQAIYQPGTAFGGSFPGGPFGKGRLSFNLQNMPAYKILNHICAESGDHLWTVSVPPSKLEKFGPNMWRIAPLDLPHQIMVLNDLKKVFPQRLDDDVRNLPHPRPSGSCAEYSPQVELFFQWIKNSCASRLFMEPPIAP